MRTIDADKIPYKTVDVDTGNTVWKEMEVAYKKDIEDMVPVSKPFRTATQQINDIAKEICDSYCYYSVTLMNQTDLDAYCAECPFTRL